MPDTQARPAVHPHGSGEPTVGPAGLSRWQLALRSLFIVHAIVAALGAMLCLFSLPSLMSGSAERSSSDWLFAVIGAAMLGAGGYLARRAWSKLQQDWRLLQDGAVGEATVTAVEDTRFSINSVRQWRISYRYTDAERSWAGSFSGCNRRLPPCDRCDRGKTEWRFLYGFDDSGASEVELVEGRRRS